MWEKKWGNCEVTSIHGVNKLLDGDQEPDIPHIKIHIAPGHGYLSDPSLALDVLLCCDVNLLNMLNTEKKSNELIKDFETNDETFDNNVYIKHHCTVLLSNTSHVIILCLQQSIQASKMVVQN